MIKRAMEEEVRASLAHAAVQHLTLGQGRALAMENCRTLARMYPISAVCMIDIEETAEQAIEWVSNEWDSLVAAGELPEPLLSWYTQDQ